MSKRKSSKKEGEPADPAWVDLCERWPTLTAGKETIYSLPIGLIERIRAESKKFFTAEQLAFEEALAAGGRTGFFRGYSFRYSLLDASLEHDPECDAISADVRRMTEDQMRTRGASERDITDHFAADERLKNEIAARERGYIGWLVTDPGFNLMRKQFRKVWTEHAAQGSDLPQLPVSFLGEKTPIPSDSDKPYVIAEWKFLQTWCLRGMTTWELPMPLRANIAGNSIHPAQSLGDAGCTLFVPWYLVRDQKLTLRDVFASQLHQASLDHLSPWFQKGPKNLGHERYGQMLQLYVYYELALKDRYLGNLRGNTKPVDRALGQFLRSLAPDDDKTIAVGESIKKVRELLNRRLKECDRISAAKPVKRSLRSTFHHSDTPRGNK